ncbi:MAG: 5-Nucleotidase domain protein [Bacteroidetes bacterium]|nr:5-Nucleotidase domain protein [Bacteroidota bacterium]
MSQKVAISIIVLFFLTACRTHYAKQNQKFEHFSLKEKSLQKVSEDSVSRFKKKVEMETARVIGLASGDLTKDGNETTLGNFVCDALKFNAVLQFPAERIDVVIVNRGGLRANIAKGEIKVLSIFELMPFENELVMVKITGESLTKFLPMVVEKKHSFLGLKIKMKDNAVVSALAGDSIIDKARIYNVVTSDYLANGGDNFFFLKEGKGILNSNLKIRDAIIGYCESLMRDHKSIDPYTDERLEVSK